MAQFIAKQCAASSCVNEAHFCYGVLDNIIIYLYHTSLGFPMIDFGFKPEAKFLSGMGRGKKLILVGTWQEKISEHSSVFHSF
jgi:hypothetical protein